MSTPKQRMQEEISQHGEWLADVTASKLYTSKTNQREIMLRIRELAEMLQEYNSKWPDTPPAPREVVRKVTMEERSTASPAMQREWFEAERAMSGAR